MLKLRRLYLLVCLVGLALLASACGNSSISGLKGRVVDTQGKGLAGITVIVPSAGLTATTSDSGTYQIAPLAPGVYTLFVTHEDYTVADEQGLMSALSSSSSNTVTVKKGKITAVNDIVMKQSQQQLDTIAFTSVTPGPQSTLTAGAEQSYAFEANYHLVSADTANMVVSIGFESAIDGKTYPFFSAVTPISKGDNTISFTHNDTIPHGKSLLYSMAIYDDNQNLLAHNAAVGSPISGWKTPKAPSISAVGTEDGIKVTWNVGYTNYEYVEITRIGTTTPLARLDRSAEVSGEWLDTNVYEGEKKSYKVCYKPIDYAYSYCNYNAAAARSVRGVSTIPINKKLTGLFFDQRRRLIYTHANSEGKLLVISPDTGEVTGIPTSNYNSAKLAMAGNGDWLFVQLQSSIIVVDASTQQTHTIATTKPILAIAAHPNGNIIYATLDDGFKQKLQAIDWQTNTVLHEVPIVTIGSSLNVPMVISPDGKYLYVYSSAINVYNTSDLSIASYYRNFESHLVINPNPTIPELYAGNRVYKAIDPWTQVDALPSAIRAVSSDGFRIYTMKYEDNQTYFDVYRSNNLSYIHVNRFVLPGLYYYAPMFTNANKLYYLQLRPDDMYDIGVFDFTGHE